MKVQTVQYGWCGSIKCSGMKFTGSFMYELSKFRMAISRSSWDIEEGIVQCSAAFKLAYQSKFCRVLWEQLHTFIQLQNVQRVKMLRMIERMTGGLHAGFFPRLYSVQPVQNYENTYVNGVVKEW
jgi:hypothetical protein